MKNGRLLWDELDRKLSYVDENKQECWNVELPFEIPAEPLMNWISEAMNKGWEVRRLEISFLKREKDQPPLPLVYFR